MKKRCLAFLLCVQMVLLTVFQTTSVVMAEKNSVEPVAAQDESGSDETIEWRSYEDFLFDEAASAWADPAMYVGLTAEFNLNDYNNFECAPNAEAIVSISEESLIEEQEESDGLQFFVDRTELMDEDGKSIKVNITDYYFVEEEDAESLWYKVEAAEGYTLPQVLVDNPYVLHVAFAEDIPSLLMLPRKGMFVGETAKIQKQMVAASAYRELNVTELPEFFDVSWSDDDVWDELEWYDLGDITSWSDILTTDYRYVSAETVILIPVEVSYAYERLLAAEGTGEYNAIMSELPEEIIQQFTDKHKANLEEHLEYLNVIENVEYSATVTLGGKVVPVTVKGKIPQTGVTLNVSAVSADQVMQEGFDIEDANEIVAALDINITNDADGTEWQPEEGELISVSIGMEALGYEDNDIFRFHHKHGEDITAYEVFVVMDGKLTMTTNGFSLYVISDFNDFNKNNPTATGGTRVVQGTSGAVTLTVGETVVFYTDVAGGTQERNLTSTWWVTDPEGTIFYEVYSNRAPTSFGTNGRWLRITALKETTTPVSLEYLYTDDINLNSWQDPSRFNENNIIHQNFQLSIVAPEPDATEDLDGYKLYIKDTVNTTGTITATLVDKNGNEVTEEILGGTISCSWERNDDAYIIPDAYKNDGKSIDICRDHGGLLQNRLTNVTYTVTATLPNGREKTASYTVYYQSEILNAGFETPQVQDRNYTFLTNGNPEVYWKTTSPGTGANLSRDIELARYSLRQNGNYETPSDFFPSKPDSGVQIAELNAENFGALYQDIISVPDEKLTWSFAHAQRGTNRNGEAMFVIIGPTQYAQEVTDYEDMDDLVTKIISSKYANRNDALTYLSNSTDGVRNSIRYKDPVTGAEYEMWYHDADKLTNANNAWEALEGKYKVPENQYRTRLFFVSDPGARSKGDANYGNLIDSSMAGTYKSYLIEYYEERYVTENGSNVLKYEHVYDMDEKAEKVIMYSSAELQNFNHFEQVENDLLSSVLINGENYPYNIKYADKPCLFIETYPTDTSNVQHFDPDDPKPNNYEEYDIVMQVFFRDTIIAVQKWVEFPKIEGTDKEALTASQKQTLIDALIAENGKGYESTFGLDCTTCDRIYDDETISISKNDPYGWYTGYIPIGDNPSGNHLFTLTENYISPLVGLELDKVTFEYYQFDHGIRKLQDNSKTYENVILEEETVDGITKHKPIDTNTGKNVYQDGIVLITGQQNPVDNIQLAEIKVTNTYKEKMITINYEAVGRGQIAIQDGHLDYKTTDSETFAYYSGKPDGVVPKADDTYSFAGWYLDKECTIPVDENHGYVDVNNNFVPNKTKTISDDVLEVTYYAKFSIGSLQIIRENGEPGQVFVYEIKDANNNTMYATLVIGEDRKGSVEIVNASFGKNQATGLNYTVTQLNDWSWRYGDNTSVTKTHKVTTGLHGATNMITVFNFPGDLVIEPPLNDLWLNGNSKLWKNTYGGGAN